MRAKVTSAATGDVLIESVLVVTTHDARVGFAVRPVAAGRVLADPRVTVAGPESALTGMARVVRSGAAYEEVLGRTRVAESAMARWVGRARRRRRVVVLVS